MAANPIPDGTKQPGGRSAGSATALFAFTCTGTMHAHTLIGLIGALFTILGPVAVQAAGQDTIDLQVRLARANASPGPIDGRPGENTTLAIKAFQRMEGMPVTGRIDETLKRRLEDISPGPTVVEYEIKEKDAAGPFLPSVPDSLRKMAELDRLGYTSAAELLAERFHMDVDALKRLNPGARFDTPGTRIKVANVESDADAKSAARIEVDKKLGLVRVYDTKETIIASFPATIGSSENPSPTGRRKVVKVSRNPTYTFDPQKLSFNEEGIEEKLTIPAGPNNPVGLVWIALDAPSYGIHGSPEPSRIRRQRSHGCVRLTNWDALKLADMVRPGVPVEFVDTDN